MGEQFLFSVIIPVYNVENYLHETIESVVDQTIGFEENIQLILVNDGSKDGSLDICREYEKKYPRNVTVVDKENGGVSSARNTGIEYIRGKYVNFLDSDDKWEPQSFEVTDCVRGLDHIEIISDNSYPGLPHDDIVFSSEATDETQTNWNGLLGYVRYRLENPVFLENLRVFPHGETVDVCVTVNADRPWKGELRFYSPALRETACVHAEAGKGRTEIRAEGLLLREDVHRWDLGDGTCFVMTAAADGLDTVSVRFGVRDFGTRDGHFTLNGRIIHLRAEANCAVFPETGYEPMTPADWDRVLRTYRSYGVNCMRFHSHVPPEAAFEAADALGMLMQPELPCWNPRNAFEDDKEYAFYRDALETNCMPGNSAIAA